jgi:hypothetical protein
VVSHSLYPQDFGEPLEWHPHGCHHRRLPGTTLRRCAEAYKERRAGAWLFAGGSQLAQLASAFTSHISTERYYWNDAQIRNVDIVDAGANVTAHNIVRLTRLDTAAEARAAGADALPKASAEDAPLGGVWVLSLGAADAAAGTPVSEFASDVATWLTTLNGAVRSGTLAAPRHVIWVTAPAVAFKPGPSVAGDVRCAAPRAGCEAATPASRRATPHGGSEWFAQPLPGDVLDGVPHAGALRALNAVALLTVRGVFPDAFVVDYEAITEALPAE